MSAQDKKSADESHPAVDRPIFAAEVQNFLSNFNGAEMWQPLEKPGQEWARFVLGGPDDVNAPHIWFIKLPPNYIVGRHYHNVHRLDIVLKGSYTLDGVERREG